MTLANAPEHLKEDARQGDPKAIAATLNHIIEPQGLTSQARVSNGSLLLLVESEEVPHAGTIVPFLHAALVSLGIDGISNAKIGGRQKGSKTTSWQETVDLENPPEEIIDAAEQMSQDEYHSPEGDEDMPFDDDMPLDDDVEEDQDHDQDQEDDDIADDDIADEEKPQKPTSKSQLPLVLLLLLVLILALGGAAFFFLPSLRSYLPFLPQEGTETEPNSTPQPATKPTSAAPATPAAKPTPATTPTAAAPATPAAKPTPATTPTATAPATPAAKPTPATTPTATAPATPTPTPTAAAPATTPTTKQTSVELIQAVRKANQAWELTQQAQSAQEWEQIATLWREASQEMAKVPPEDSRYDIAQDRIGRYEAYALFADQMATIKGQ
ncbi:MAG: hypothetical protein Fur0025_26430 [Oscillatoriaceae cyanobacterium]